MFLYDWILHRVSTEWLKCVIFFYYLAHNETLPLLTVLPYGKAICVYYWASLWGLPKFHRRWTQCVHCTNWEKTLPVKVMLCIWCQTSKWKKKILADSTRLWQFTSYCKIFFICFSHVSTDTTVHSHHNIRRSNLSKHIFSNASLSRGWKGEHLV